jgi:hypothetical protein
MVYYSFDDMMPEILQRMGYDGGGKPIDDTYDITPQEP